MAADQQWITAWQQERLTFIVNHNIRNLYWRCEPVFPMCFLPCVILFSVQGWGTHQRRLIRALALSAMCLYPSSIRLWSNTCKKQLEGGKISFGSWFRGYSRPWLEGTAAGLALFLVAGDCFLTSLWNRIQRRGNTEVQRLSLLPFYSDEDPVTLRINVSLLG